MKNCLRVISVLLCLMLCLALCPVTAESTYDETRLTEAVSLLNGGRSGVLPEEYTVQVDPKALGAAKGLSKKVLNLLFVGMDTDGAEGNGPGDLVLLCSIQTKTGEVTLVNLDEALLRQAMDAFYWIRSLSDVEKKPSTSELVDWIRALQLSGIDPERIIHEIPFAGVLLKKDKDVTSMQRRLR